MLGLDARDFLASPEVVVMAALYLARSWLDDGEASWKCDGSSLRRVFFATQMCILDDPSTSLLRITEQDMKAMIEGMALPAPRIGPLAQRYTGEGFYAKFQI